MFGDLFTRHENTVSQKACVNLLQTHYTFEPAPELEKPSTWDFIPLSSLYIWSDDKTKEDLCQHEKHISAPLPQPNEYLSCLVGNSQGKAGYLRLNVS